MQPSECFSEQEVDLVKELIGTLYKSGLQIATKMLECADKLEEWSTQLTGENEGWQHIKHELQETAEDSQVTCLHRHLTYLNLKAFRLYNLLNTVINVFTV